MSDFTLFGNNLFGDPITQKKNGVLAERFEFPPFSVLNAREGAWQERKRAWLAMGIKSEIGRSKDPAFAGDCFRGTLNHITKGTAVDIIKVFESAGNTTSIFDPTLCEIIYRWFCPEGGQIVDPFAGGSVRGIVAGLLGYKYHGIDLRPEQVEANYVQKAEICPDAFVEWVVGDSRELMDASPDADFIFSCPPYGDLERYSDDPADLSTMEYHTFIAAYKRIILKCATKLKPGGMACFVVGDFRDKRTGAYRGFVADTIKAFQDCGMEFYNDAVLITCVGSLPIRVGKQFVASKKLGKTHQNVLVFRKPVKKAA